MTQAKHYRFWRYEEGFTLFEVLTTIIIMGIVFAIASSTWFGVVEGRSVDSAANQLAADLRQAHSSAVNRLTSWEVVLTSGSSSYQIGKVGEALENRNFCDDGSHDASDDADGCDDNDPTVEITGGGTATITFNSDGSASVAPCDAPTACGVTVDGDPIRNVVLTPTTSRVDVV